MSLSLMFPAKLLQFLSKEKSCIFTPERKEQLFPPSRSNVIFYKNLIKLLVILVEVQQRSFEVFEIQIGFVISWLLFFLNRLGKIVMLVNKVERYFVLRGKPFFAHER